MTTTSPPHPPYPPHPAEPPHPAKPPHPAPGHPTPPGTGPSTADLPPVPPTGVAAFAVAHRWWIVLTALLLTAGSVLLLGQGIRTTPPQEQLVGDSAAAVRILQDADFGTRPTEFLVATVRTGTLAPAEALALGSRLAAAYAGIDGVERVGAPVPGQDARSVVVPIELRAARSDTDTSLPQPKDAVAGSLAVTARLAAANPDLVVGQFGNASAGKELDETVGRDFQRAELVSIPITLLVLLVAFGAVVAAGVPLALGIGSVVTALGLTAAVSQRWVSVDPNAQSLILLIGLAVGVDYALFILRRAAEERALGRTPRDAVLVASATAGRAVVISGLTVMVAIAGMLVAGGLFTSIAVGTLLVVAVAVLASATVLPALLAILGHRVDALRLPFARRRAARAGSTESVWGRLAGRVTARPTWYAAAAAAGLLALATPALGMRTALSGVEGLPKDLAVVAAYRQLQQAAPTDTETLQVVVRADPTATATVRAALERGAGVARTTAHVSAVADQPQVSMDGSVSVLDIAVDLDPSDDRLPPVIEEVRERVVPVVQAGLVDVPGAAVHIGGAAAATDLAAWMDARLPWVAGFVLALTLLVMLVSFGSVWLAVATVLLNGLSVAAAYGVTTAVFQGTWAERWLDFTSVGSIASWLPLVMFVVLFGLSMDYHVFVTSRVREARDAGADPRSAVRLGVARSAGVVTSAAAVMVGVFSVFGTLSMLELKQLGVGLAVAVLLDATVVRGVLLPAALAMLGDRAHTGPTWLPRIHH